LNRAVISHRLTKLIIRAKRIEITVY